MSHRSSPADPVVSPADTIREKAQQIIDRPQSPYGGSESGEEAWHWTHDWLAGFARDVLALLAVGERDRQQIARLGSKVDGLRLVVADQKRTVNALYDDRERDRQQIARLTEALQRIASATDVVVSVGGSLRELPYYSANGSPFPHEIARAVLAGEEDARG